MLKPVTTRACSALHGRCEQTVTHLAGTGTVELLTESASISLIDGGHARGVA
jgi:hypothetical protein